MIPSREVIGLNRDAVRQNSPLIRVFGSGEPEPSPSNYSWFFNGDPIFLNGRKDSSVINVDSVFVGVSFEQIALKSTIDSSIAGTYVSVVRTSEGETNVSVTVNVEGETCVSLTSPAQWGLCVCVRWYNNGYMCCCS